MAEKKTANTCRSGKINVKCFIGSDSCCTSESSETKTKIGTCSKHTCTAIDDPISILSAMLSSSANFIPLTISATSGSNAWNAHTRHAINNVYPQCQQNITTAILSGRQNRQAPKPAIDHRFTHVNTLKRVTSEKSNKKKYSGVFYIYIRVLLTTSTSPIAVSEMFEFRTKISTFCTTNSATSARSTVEISKMVMDLTLDQIGPW